MWWSGSSLIILGEVRPRVFVIATLAAALVVPTVAHAAKVNCSYAACLKECKHRGASNNGCSTWCSNAMTERQNAGQWPRK
jgi:hypothetical protein